MNAALMKVGVLPKEDEIAVARAIESLEKDFEISKNMDEEPETLEIVGQLLGRALAAYGQLSSVRGKRILDIACGSRTSRAPCGLSRSARRGYTTLFEPWFCRILSALGAQAVGIDIGDLGGESFEHYQVDLARAGALDFLPPHSFDAVHDSRLFGSPEFTARFPHRSDALRIAKEIVDQERRVLKQGGVLIHSDAHDLIGAR